MKWITMTIAIVILCCSCSLEDNTFVVNADKHAPTYNTFMEGTTGETPSSFSFLILSDAHLIRTNSGAYFIHEEFKEWLNNSNPYSLDFALFLGDLTDKSKELEYLLFKEFIEATGLQTYSIMGNHDARNKGPEYFQKYIHPAIYYRFTHKGVSFYMLDTSLRIFGKKQMAYLEQALKEDTNQKKVFATHMPLYGSEGLFYLTLADTQERNLMIKLMAQNNVGMYLSGHYHKGDIFYQYSDTMTEFIAGAFHGMETIFEGPARWYVAQFDADENMMTIIRFSKPQKGSLEESIIARIPF